MARKTARDELHRKALSLSEQNRAERAGALIDSLLGSFEKCVEEAWRAEIERRARDLDAGVEESIPWEVVKARLVRASRD